MVGMMCMLVLAQLLLLSCLVPGLRSAWRNVFAGPRRVRTAFWRAVGEAL